MMKSMDYSLIAKLVASADLVGVGESTHGAHEFFEFKTELFKELAQKHQFKTLYLEDSIEVCRHINDYIATGRGDIDKLMDALYSVWRVKELRSLFEWLKDNYKRLPVTVRGFDLVQNGQNLAKRDEFMAKSIYDHLKQYPDAKGMVWAHNAHIKYGSNRSSTAMGHYLRHWKGGDYIAVGQFFGEGNVNATLLSKDSLPSNDRALSTISVPMPPVAYLESVLNKIDHKPYHLPYWNLNLSLAC